MKILVLLSDGTMGFCDALAKEGDTVLVFFHDENGIPVQKWGQVAEILGVL